MHKVEFENVTLWHGDCRDILPLLTGIDAVVSDPPYGMNWNTDTSRFTSERHSTVNGKRVAGRNDEKAVMHDDEQFDPSPWAAFPQCVLFGYHHFAAALPVGSVLVWIKKFDQSFGTFLSDAEMAWMKGGHGIYCKRDTSINGEASSRLHPPQKPVSIMAWTMDKAKVMPGATVLDPFMGSASTGIACIRTGRKFVGIEKDAVHFATACKRIEQELSQLQLAL